MRNVAVSKTPEYRAWSAMKSRCSNANVKCSAHYLGRGVTVCADWEQSFDSFLSHVGYRPSDKHSLDRIDNNGNYEPGNVRWATQREQLLNRRGTRTLEINGEQVALSECARAAGLRYGTLMERVKAGRVGPELVLPTSALKFKKYTTFNGQQITIADLARKLGFSPNVLNMRISHRGMTAEQAIAMPVKKRNRVVRA